VERHCAKETLEPKTFPRRHSCLGDLERSFDVFFGISSFDSDGLLEKKSETPSFSERLDGHQPDEFATGATEPHGSLDGLANDRLGWVRRELEFA
jgi:hypothetical protein